MREERGRIVKRKKEKREQWERTWFVKHFTWFLNCWLINRVLETRFSGRRHMEKTLHQTWSEHENRPSKTRFIAQKSSLLTRDVSKKYSLKTVPTNYIVWQTGLISHFGCETTNKAEALKPNYNIKRRTKLTKHRSITNTNNILRERASKPNFKQLQKCTIT